MRFLLVFCAAMLCSYCGNNEAGQQHPREEKSAAFSLTVDSSSDLPDCVAANSRQLIYLVAEQKFMHCYEGQWQPIDIRNAAFRGESGSRGEPGEQGPRGERGESAAYLGIGLYDAQGKLLGYPDSPTFSAESDRYIMFIDGMVGQIRPSTGQVMLGDNSCYYESADCSSACYSVHGPEDPVGNHLLERVVDKRLVHVPIGAVSESAFYYSSRWSGGGCEATKGYSPKRFVTQVWQPNGVALPLNLPLKVRILH